MSKLNIDFNIDDYKQLFPEIPDTREIINYNASSIDECVWKPNRPNVITKDYLELEAKRLRQGCWIRIKDDIWWIPPNVYQFLNYGTVSGGVLPSFRLALLKYAYKKILAQRNSYCIGNLIIKGRQFGLTTFEMNNVLVDCQYGLYYSGIMGLQSTDHDSVINANFGVLKNQFNNYPKYLHDLFYHDLVSSTPTKKGEKKRMHQTFAQFESLGNNNTQARNIRIDTYTSTKDKQGMDGESSVINCVLDEICKWQKDFQTAYNVYKRFIQVGRERKGFFTMFSSPATSDTTSNAQVYDLWKQSNPLEVDKFGATESGLQRIYLDPTEGLNGFYDKWGDCDVEAARNWILNERSKKKTAKDLLEEIRAYPLSEEEMFSSFDSESNWDNYQGMADRKIYLAGTKYKDEQTLEPKYIVGNLEWENGVLDSKVVHKPFDGMEFDLTKGRFKFANLPNFTTPLKNVFYPPESFGNTIDSVIGIDPFKNVDSGTSQGAAVQYKFKDVLNPDYIEQVESIYLNRPHRSVFFEDMIKYAVFTRSKIQVENIDKEIIDYIKQRGYEAWLIPAIGTNKNEKKYGDAAKGNGANMFYTNAESLINWFFNTRINPDEPYHLQHIQFEELIQDVLKCNIYDPTSRKQSDLTMALLQALLGASKLKSKKIRRGVKGLGGSILSTVY